ncbi:MAG: hypothetical protein WC802_01570 [Patescibacteria group bacterium]|jgi:hypothetical protein
MNEFLRRREPDWVARGVGTPDEIEARADEMAQREGETSPTAIAKKCEDLAREYGPEALRAMLASMQKALDEGRSLKSGELLEPLKEKPPHSEVRERILNILEQSGIIEKRADGVLIVDDERLFAEFNKTKNRKLTEDATPGYNSLGASRLERLGNTFAGEKTVLKSELEQNPEAEPKPLFYLPEYQADALDIQKIKQAKFHFGLWEVPAGTSGSETAAATRQPATVTEISFLEASIPALLYHPKYGDAKRDENGRLLVKTGGEYKPLSRKWLNEVGGLTFSHEGRPNAMDSKAIELISAYAPELLKRGLLKESDFGKEAQGRQTAETIRVSASGTVQIDAVRHYIGRQFKDRQIRIDKLDNGQAVIVELDENGIATPLSVMNVFARGNPDLKESKTSTSSFFEAGGKLTNIREMPETGLEGYEAFLDFDNKLRQETDDSVFELTKDLRQEFMTHPVLIEKNREQFTSLVSVSGKNGLETIGALLDNTEICERVVSTALALPEQERATVLPLLREASLARRDALKALNEAKTAGKIKDLDYRKMTFEINRRLTSLLTAAEDTSKVRESRNETERDTAAAKLAEQGHELVLFTTLFKGSFKGAEKLNFDEMKNLRFAESTPDMLTDQDREEMLAIFDKNWEDQDRVAAAAFRKVLEAKFEKENTDTHFYTLKKDGQLAAFMRFDHRDDIEPGAYYAGSLNIAPSLRGSAIGEAFMKNTLDAEAEKHPIYAHFIPDAIVGAKYVEDGLLITGITKVTAEGKSSVELSLRRDDRRTNQFKARAKGVTPEALMAGMEGVRILSFDYSKEKSAFIQAIKDASHNGEVISRYWLDPKNSNRRYLAIEPDIPVPARAEDVEAAA